MRDPGTCYKYFFSDWNVHNASKECFWLKKFKFHAFWHFGEIEKLPKWHFWTCAWNLTFFLTKSLLLKHYEKGNKKKISQLVPGSKSRIYVVKSTKRGFSKKDSRESNFFSCFRLLWIYRMPGTLNWDQVVFFDS